MPSAFDVYYDLYKAGWLRTWKLTRHAPWTFALPIVVLALHAVMDRYVVPLHQFARYGVAFVNASSWGAVFWVLTRLALGASAKVSDLVIAAERRLNDVPTLALNVLTGTIVFLLVDAGSCCGLLWVASASPILEFVLFENDHPMDAARHAWDFLSGRWASWVLPQWGLLLAVSFAWTAVVTGLGLTIGAMNQDLVIVASLIGAILLGPVIHLLLVQRAVMFLELKRLTHRQRMFQARQ
jgi:hypothetical protein